MSPGNLFHRHRRPRARHRRSRLLGLATVGALAMGGPAIHLASAEAAITSPESVVTVGQVGLHVGDGPAAVGRLALELHNSGPADVQADTFVVYLDGAVVGNGGRLRGPVIPGGGSTTINVPVSLELDKTAGEVEVSSAIIATDGTPLVVPLQASVPLELSTTPTSSADRVDFGEPASEAAHSVARSSLRVSARVHVPAGQHFVVRGVEAFAGPGTRQVRVAVNDGSAKTVTLTRQASGPGEQAYDMVLPTPAALRSTGGTVTLSVSHPGATTTPSPADLWTFAPPVTGTVDHVDLGNAASETAHSVQALSTHTVAGEEAGLTRRYTQQLDGEVAADVAVPRTGPFVIRVLETFPGPVTKDLVISVDGVRLPVEQLSVMSGPPTAADVDVVVDDPRALAETADGRAVVRISTLHPSPYNASTADIWVLGAP